MSNYFNEVSKDAKKMEEKLLGPDYKYYKQIKSPSELNMSPDGNMGALANDIAGIVNYTDLLVGGGGAASKTGDVLGNSFFLKTGGHCIDENTGEKVDRYAYINNIPDGSIPFLSNTTGIKAESMKGLLPGILSDTAKINPMGIFSSFMKSAEPKCREVTRTVVDANGNKSKETRHIPISELKEGFSKLNQNEVFDFDNVYLLMVGLFFLYLFNKLYYKK